jgi:hypothetical protein
MESESSISSLSHSDVDDENDQELIDNSAGENSNAEKSDDSLTFIPGDERKPKTKPRLMIVRIFPPLKMIYPRLERGPDAGVQLKKKRSLQYLTDLIKTIWGKVFILRSEQ